MGLHKINKDVLIEICNKVAEGVLLIDIAKTQEITYSKLIAKLKNVVPNEYRDAKIADSKRRLKQLSAAKDKLINGFETVSEKTEFLIGKDGIPRPSKIVREKIQIPPAASTVNMYIKRAFDKQDKKLLQTTENAAVVWNETKTYESPQTEIGNETTE